MTYHSKNIIYVVIIKIITPHVYDIYQVNLEREYKHVCITGLRYLHQLRSVMYLGEYNFLENASILSGTNTHSAMGHDTHSIFVRVDLSHSVCGGSFPFSHVQ